MALVVKPKDVRLAGTFFKKEFHTKLYEGLRMKKRGGTLYEFFRQHGISLKVETEDGTPLPSQFLETLTKTLDAPPPPHTGHSRVKKDVIEQEEKKEEAVVVDVVDVVAGTVVKEEDMKPKTTKPKPKPKVKKLKEEETPVVGPVEPADVKPVSSGVMPLPAPLSKTPEKKEHWKARRARMLRPVAEVEF